MNTRVGGRYQLVEEIAAGKVGRVYRALDTESGVTVAAKVLTAMDGDNMQAFVRFYLDAAVLSSLKHPNIVRVYETFLEHDSNWIIMELLEGRSLAQILEQEALPLVRIKNLARQVAAALTYAHGRNVVHRDLKPSNIMVVGNDEVKVTDFELAHILRQDVTLATITRRGMNLQGMYYGAPEQIEGAEVDARADIYALGSILYHLVARRPPFEGLDPLTVAFKIVNEPATPPTLVNPQVPPDWNALLLRTLQKNPADRFESAAALEEAILALGPRLERESRATFLPPSSPPDSTLAIRSLEPPSHQLPAQQPAHDMPLAPAAVTLWEQGRAQERSGNLAAAIESYRAGLNVCGPGEMQHDLQISLVRVLRMQGQMKEKVGDVTGALDDYRMALATAPSQELPADLIKQIDRLASGSVVTPRTQPIRQQRVRRRWPYLPIAVALVLIAAVIALVYSRSRGSSSGLSIAQAQATATAQAKKTQAANALAAAQTTAALRGKGELVGPTSSELTPLNIHAWAGQNLRDFVTRVRFVNPAVLPTSSQLPNKHWGYGIWFRNFQDGGQFRLMLYSTKKFALIKHNMTGESMDLGIITRGNVPGLNVAAGGVNDVTLLVAGKRAVFSVNGQVIQILDVSGKMTSGDLAVVAEDPWDLNNSTYTRPLRYENFAVWSLARGGYGPKAGDLTSSGPRFAGLWIRDFIASVRLYNPASRTTQPWDYGLAFRNSVNAGQLRLVLDSHRRYHLRLHQMSGQLGLRDLTQGPVPDLNTTPGGFNDVTVFVVGNTGVLLVNGQVISRLDLSAMMTSGDVGPSYGPISDSASYTSPLRFERFIVWPVVDTAPSAAAGGSSQTVATPAPASLAKVIDGIPCQAHMTGYLTRIHLAIFNAGNQIPVPAGIGVNDAAPCFYWLHTSTPDGWVHVTGPHTVTPQLGDLFAIWGQPLSKTQVATARVGSGETMQVYVNGKAYHGDPRSIPLARLTQITIEVGPPFAAPKVYPTPVPTPVKKK